MSTIHINPANKGKFTETKKRTGKSTEELTHSKNPLTRKRAIFAQNARKWSHALGGYLYGDGGELNPEFGYGGNWSDGVTEFNAGGTHESNPSGGIPQGTDSNGKPNLVEQGETKWNNYIFSNRLTVPQDVAPLLGLKGKISFADASKKLQLEAKERPNDPISKRGLTNSMAKLKSLQDIMKEQLEQAKVHNGIEGKVPAVNYGAYGMNLYDGISNPTATINPTFDWNNVSPQEQQYIKDYMSREYSKFPSLQAKNPKLKQQNLFNYGYYDGKNGIDSFKYYKNGNYTPEYNNFTTHLPSWVADEFNSHSSGKIGNNKNVPLSKISSLMSDRHRGYAHEFAQAILDAHNSYKGNPTVSPASQVSESPQKYESVPWNDRGPYDFLRFAPVVGGAVGVLGDALGITNKPDYSYGNAVLSAANNVGRMGAPHIGNYMQYNPMDRQYYINQLNAQSGALNENLRDNSGGNRAALNASLIAGNNNYNNALGDIGMKAQLYNNQLRQQVGEFNRGTDQFNAEQDYRVNAANMQRDQGLIAAAQSAAQLGLNQDVAASQGRSANLTNLFNNLGELGRESQQRGWLMNLAKHGVFGNGTEYNNADKKAMGGMIKTKKQKHITY